MRSINWDKSLSEEDEAWILTSGSMELENRLKATEAAVNTDVDLSQFAVKPENTAGPPAGWGSKS